MARWWTIRLAAGAWSVVLSALVVVTAAAAVRFSFFEGDVSPRYWAAALGIAVSTVLVYPRVLWSLAVRGYWMPTWSGRRFYFLRPERSAFDVRDIARALSHVGRFGGHSSSMYTVAQHLVLASRLVAPEYAKEAFCHDWAEAYLGDVVTPLKQLLPGYKKIERGVERAIGDWLGLDLVNLPPEVKRIDRLLYLVEAASFTRHKEREDEIPEDVRGALLPLEAWSSKFAEEEFLKRFAELFPAEAERVRQSG